MIVVSVVVVAVVVVVDVVGLLVLEGVVGVELEDVGFEEAEPGLVCNRGWLWRHRSYTAYRQSIQLAAICPAIARPTSCTTTLTPWISISAVAAACAVQGVTGTRSAAALSSSTAATIDFTIDPITWAARIST